MRFAETGHLPDATVRLGIRHGIRKRLRAETRHPEHRWAAMAELRSGPIAPGAALADAEYDEIPVDFLRATLGPRMKYSACYWSPGVTDLAEAEDTMLELIAERARLTDGMDILDLGCGWGSFALWAADRYPSSRIVAVSNSVMQKAYIDARARELGLANLTAETADIAEFNPRRPFDRVVSIEVFEHLRNYGVLLRRIAAWLAVDGRLFIDMFCHRRLLYGFDSDAADNAIGHGFFMGGLMPASDTLSEFQQDLRLERQWNVNGRHYEKTARAWLRNLDANRLAATAALSNGDRATIDDAKIARAIERWRIFFMACEELFSFDDYSQWQVSHYLFAPRLPLASDDV